MPQSSNALTAHSALVPWKDPELTGINRLPGRAFAFAHPTATDALKDERRLAISLNGVWRFRLVESVEATPAEFAAADFEPENFGSISVPGNWTMQGFGLPHYTNSWIPFDQAPPDVPDKNPTGLYWTSFELPEGWDERRVVLQFGGVESCFSVWLNGEPIGVGKDSRLPSEFEVSRAVRRGKNRLAVQVIQWSDGTFVEDQDHWWQAGIYRDVVLRATATTWIEDVFARPDYDHETGRGKLRVEVRAGGLKETGWRIRAELYDPQGSPALEQPLSVELPFQKPGSGYSRPPVVLNAALESVRAWSAETPSLYTLIVSLLDASGKEV
ncbi:MAG TPA: hypothetical protein VGJ84_17825, partial [Polyangiaceae bacterium]